MSIPRRDPFSILNKESDKWLQPEPFYKKRTTQRYKAGQAPQWELDEDDIFTEDSDRKTMISLGNTSITSEKLKTKFYQQDKQQQQQSQDGIQQEKVIRRPRRVVQQTEIVEEKEEETKERNTQIEEEFKVPKIPKKKKEALQIEEIDMNSEVLSRRARLKQRLQQESLPDNAPQAQIEKTTTEIHQKALQQKEQMVNNNSDSEDEDDGNSSDSSINDEEDQESISEENDSKKDYLSDAEQREQISLMKPVFVPREVRETREKYFEEEIKLEEEKKATEQRKKQETKMFVIEAIRNKNKDETEENSEGEEMPDDDDNVNEKLEYESWKVRELKRIHREREESQKYEKQQKEILRRRNLTDEQRIIENIKLGSDQTELKKLKESKTNYRFMQKFYKMGAFYLDSDDPIFKRDYNIAVGEDLRDKSSLPKYLQKRRGQIGMRGQTKYTHLTDQDTNNFDPFYKIDEQLFQKQLNKTAGYKGTNVMDRSNLKKVKL